MPKKLISGPQFRERYGGISEMTEYRWTHDPELNFPKPVYIRKRKYWDEAALDAFDAAQLAAASQRFADRVATRTDTTETKARISEMGDPSSKAVA